MTLKPEVLAAMLHLDNICRTGFMYDDLNAYETIRAELLAMDARLGEAIVRPEFAKWKSELEAGKHCVLFGVSTGDMTRDELLIFIGFLDKHMLNVRKMAADTQRRTREFDP